MATERNIRVSDADRDAVAAQLREHYAQGRLTLDELNDRLDRTFKSRTNLELASVTSDLPYAPPRGVLPSDWARGGSGWTGADPGGRGGYDGYGPRRHRGSILGLVHVMLAVSACLLLAGALGFGVGSGPSLMVIALGALAVLRWLFGLGRRRGMPMRRRAYRCRRRW